MRKIQNNQQGFSAVEAVLIIVVLGILGFTGWFVYKSQKDTSKTLNNSGNSSVNTNKKSTAPKDETAEWTEYNSANNTYALRIPDGWKLTENGDDGMIYGTGNNILYQPGVLASVTHTTEGRDGLYGFFVSFDKAEQAAKRTFAGYTKVGDFKTNTGLTGTRYTFKYTSDTVGIGPSKGTVEYVYYFMKDKTGIYVQYDLVPGAVDQLAVVELAVKTLTFK